MKLWENIINKASLGSGKEPLKSAELPEIIAEKFALSDSPDQEEDFLRFSSLVYQFRQAGWLPLNFKVITQIESGNEIKSYCSVKANGALKAILEEGVIPF